MGGINGDFRGKSKVEAFLKYAAYCDEHPDFETRLPDPQYKKVCYREMVQDPETGEWVLQFHLHR